jgi:hypothetical protein
MPKTNERQNRGRHQDEGRASMMRGDMLVHYSRREG